MGSDRSPLAFHCLLPVRIVAGSRIRSFSHIYGYVQRDTHTARCFRSAVSLSDKYVVELQSPVHECFKHTAYSVPQRDSMSIDSPTRHSLSCLSRYDSNYFSS